MEETYLDGEPVSYHALRAAEIDECGRRYLSRNEAGVRVGARNDLTRP